MAEKFLNIEQVYELRILHVTGVNPEACRTRKKKLNTGESNLFRMHIIKLLLRII